MFLLKKSRNIKIGVKKIPRISEPVACKDKTIVVYEVKEEIEKPKKPHRQKKSDESSVEIKTEE